MTVAGRGFDLEALLFLGAPRRVAMVRLSRSSRSRRYSREQAVAGGGAVVRGATVAGAAAGAGVVGAAGSCVLFSTAF